MQTNFDQARDFFLRGVAHYQARRFREAEASFSAALDLVPGRASTLTNLGATRLRLGKFQEAAELLAEALAQEPDNVEALWHHATALAELGEVDDALASADKAVALAPGEGRAWALRGSLLKELGRVDEAIASLQNAIARGADNEMNRYALAALVGGDVPQAPPREYVEGLFNSYAEGFDRHLVEVLNYRVPEALTKELRGMRRRFSSALDLGCGTGLCGPLLRPLAARVEGVDLSHRMVEKARSTGAYDEVSRDDIVHYLSHASKRYDCVIAADVFIYVGALEEVFAGVARNMEPAGVFCFSVEDAGDAGDLVLRPSMRYAHSRGYIERLASEHGFDIRKVTAHAIREDQREPIAGWLFWLERRPS
jgi:predicted TPR repeat methyltransferase